ncbi:uncharacterized protein PV06_07518 [Exophiala oligosperma]|uniref:Beta-lactamase-related domain-containing protein n=1 Tax=Exophiala oligosperma TaxID=215243 RepID=A0A0D2AJJ1_9EURO|nr:uncharacterized protein PV06_07518 [Exophiala oligosperma]KIW40311.1 hypothetical protein PV06_07518 [Exophiala oligosperma]
MAEDSIENAFQAALDSAKIHGAIICSTDSHGYFTYNESLGQRTLLSGEKKPQQLDDVCFLASATKLITTIAALQCVEDGLLTLKGDLSSIAPDLTSKQVMTGFSDDGEPILVPPDQPITLEMLLTHSSGLTYHFMNPLVARWREKFGQTHGPGRRYTVEELYNYPLAFQPGSSWMYGPGLDWAGRIVERVTSKTLLERMQERIFTPLEITDAQFYPVTRDDLRVRMPDLNPDDPDGTGLSVVGGSTDANGRTKGDFGGQGLFMTTPDYLKVMRSVLANDEKILRSETVNDIMFQPRLSTEAAKGLEGALVSPLGVFFRCGTSPDTKASYGLSGVLTLQDVEAWYGEGTLTWGGGLTFTWFIDRKNDICAAGAINAALPFDGEVVSKLKDTIRHDVYRKRAEWQKQRAAS